MNSWFHCNNCFMMGAGGNGSFWFTSCGHLICSNCLKLSGAIPGQKSPCIVCRRQDSMAIEINRSMRVDILAMFRPPRDLAQEYSTKLRTVMEFQTTQGQHLLKHLHEKSTKAMKFAKAAQSEIAKRTEREQSMATELSQVKAELEKSKQYTHHLKNVLSERDQEIQRLKHKSPRAPICRGTPSPHKNKIPVHTIFPSLNGPTPLSQLSSFYACATSTPYEQNRRDAPPPTPFGPMGGLFDTPQAREDSTIAGGGPDYFKVTNTPALLGINPQGERRTSSSGGSTLKKNYF